MYAILPFYPRPNAVWVPILCVQVKDRLYITLLVCFWFVCMFICAYKLLLLLKFFVCFCNKITYSLLRNIMVKLQLHCYWRILISLDSNLKGQYLTVLYLKINIIRALKIKIIRARNQVGACGFDFLHKLVFNFIISKFAQVWSCGKLRLWLITTICAKTLGLAIQHSEAMLCRNHLLTLSMLVLTIDIDQCLKLVS